MTDDGRALLNFKTLDPRQFKLVHAFGQPEVICEAQDVKREAKCDDPLENSYRNGLVYEPYGRENAVPATFLAVLKQAAYAMAKMIRIPAMIPLIKYATRNFS